MIMRTQAERLVCGAGLYKPVRDIYHHVLNRPYLHERRLARAFFRPFVPPGSVVFDLGANRGRRSELFLELGAKRVVAVEPIPDLADVIARHYPDRRLIVERCAIGREPGEATLHVGVDVDHSTISEDWVQRVHEHPDLPDRWAGTIQVPVRSLDQLVEAHGIPSFIKIDIEGYEFEALSGLNHAPTALAFEFQCPTLDLADACLSRLGELGGYEFRMGAGEQFEFMDSDWTDRAGMMRRLEQLREQDPTTHGDVYARTV